jgi:hypothetical protein
MGLDVYLYRLTKPQAQIDAENEKWEVQSTRIFNRINKAAKAEGRKKLTDAEQAEWKRLSRDSAAEFGRVIVERDDHWPQFNHPDETCIEMPSAKYPDNLFKIGYFRSSYNSGGINVILRENVGTSLSEIMGHDDEEYCFCPDWEASRERAVKALNRLRELDASTKFNAIEIDVFNPFATAKPAVAHRAEAVAIAKAVVDENREPSDFMNGKGLFVLKSKPACIAYIAGTTSMGMPTVFGVYEAKPGDVFGWYVKAMEIVVETCDYVLGTGEANKHFLHWSG